MRVTVDRTTHPIHDDVPYVSAQLSETGEVQVAQVGQDLIVIISGQVEQDTDPWGNLRIRVLEQ